MNRLIREYDAMTFVWACVLALALTVAPYAIDIPAQPEPQSGPVLVHDDLEVR